MSGLLEGKRLLVTGVLTDDSLAYAVAELAQREGAEIVLTGAGRGLSLTRRVARHLPTAPDVLELDVTTPEHVDAVAADLGARWGALDGVLHSIGFAPAACMGGGFLDAGWDDVKVALEVSAFSLKLLGVGFRPLLQAAGGGSIVGLDFDATVAWPGYDWMGVAKAALESTARYLARDLGPDHIRVNLVAAGPIKTMAARSIPGFSRFEEVWDDRSPLGWKVDDPTPVARACVALLSDWFPATTGEIIHVDGGYHALGV
jgi:enoyl-[acyl-carrier protein] reductase I